MKKHNILFQLVIAACIGMLFHGCQKDEPYGLLTLKAVVSDDYGHPAGSKTHIIDKCVYWDNGDFVNINGTRFDLNVATNESVTTATIDSVPVNTNGYVAVYPAGFVTMPGSVTPNSTSVGITIPRILYMKPGHTQNTQGLMVATMAYGGTSLSFHNAGSVLALDVTNGFINEAELKLYRIVVESSTSGLSGAGTLTIDGSAPSYSITGSDALTLDMEDDIILHNETKTYYIPIPPQEQDGGTQFTIIIYATNDDNHYTFTRNSQSGLTVQRNKQVTVSVELNANPSGYTTNTIVGNYGLMGSGTEADPYVIATLKDLEYFRSQVNGGNTYSSKYIRQTTDIDAHDINWTPIGTSSKMFSGTYDGGGHSVNITMNPTSKGFGFFGWIKNATIKNLITNGSCEEQTWTNIGGICGDATNGSNTIICCQNNIDLYGNANVGGIIGQAGTITIDTCKNTGAIKAKNNNADSPAGGIVGFVTGELVCISNSVNTGNVTSSGKIAGGILGKCYCPINGSYIKNSYSHGTINATNYSNGIVWVNPNSNSIYKMNVSNCYFNGTLTGAYRAAILYYHNYKSNFTVSNCFANSDCGYTTTNTLGPSATFGSTGSLSPTITVYTQSCSTLYAALHTWIKSNTSYSDWKNENIPHLKWE